MQNGKKIAAIVGGAAGTVVVALLVFLFMAMQARNKAEKKMKSAEKNLEAEIATASSPEFAAKAEADEKASVERRRKMISEGAALSPRRGDGIDRSTFLGELVNSVESLRSLKNPVTEMPITAADFKFGFDSYRFGGNVEGKEIEDSELPALQRRLDHVSYLVQEVLWKSGVLKINALKETSGTDQSAESAQTGGEAQDGQQAAEARQMKSTYAVSFECEPEALVKTLEALSTGTSLPARFTVVDKMTFACKTDAIKERVERRAAALKAAESGASARGTSGRAPRRHRGAQTAENEEKKDDLFSVGKRIAFDPEHDGTLQVELQVSFYEFEEPAAAEEEPEAAESGEDAE